MRRMAFVMCALLMVGIMPLSAQSGGMLAVAWSEGQFITLWREDGLTVTTTADASVLDVSLSTDGTMVAFTYGNEGLPQGLGLLLPDGTTRTLVTSDALNGAYIGQLDWFGSGTIYFNTMGLSPMLGALSNNDLWRVDVASGEVQQVLDTGEGGAFTISPTGDAIAIVYPGTFDDMGNVATEGEIRVSDLFGEGLLTLFTFLPVATGAPRQFYPQVHWLSTGDALQVAIPPADVLYVGGDTMLWQLQLDGTSNLIGQVNASLFGQPEWSANGASLVHQYETNDGMILRVADATGQSDKMQALAQLHFFRWSQVGEHFLWVEDNSPNVFAVGTPQDTQLQFVSGYSLFDVQWLGESGVAFTASIDDGLGLYVMRVDEEPTQLAGLNFFPYIDGVFIPFAP